MNESTPGGEEIIVENGVKTAQGPSPGCEEIIVTVLKPVMVCCGCGHRLSEIGDKVKCLRCGLEIENSIR